MTPAPVRLGPFRVTDDPRQWPDVCKFTSGAQLHALDPQIIGVRGAPIGQHAQIIGGNGGLTPRPTDCHFNLRTRFDTADTTANPSWIDISLQEADSLAPGVFAQEESSGAAKRYPHLPGGLNCYVDTGHIVSCLRGNIFYEIQGVKDTGGVNFEADQGKWINEIVLPLAETIGTELKS